MTTRPLSEMGPDERGVIVRVGGTGEIRRRLLDMGVVAGAEVEVERVAPLGDPIQIKVKGYDLALRKGEAEKILVNETIGPLVYAEIGKALTVVSVRAGWGLQRRLRGMGIQPGTTLTILSAGRPGQFMVEAGGSRLALGHGMAAKILVKSEVSHGS